MTCFTIYNVRRVHGAATATAAGAITTRTTIT